MQQRMIVGTTLCVDGQDNLAERVAEAEEAGVDRWHVDMCMPPFAPESAGNLTFLDAFLLTCTKEVEAHIMSNSPLPFIDRLETRNVRLCTPHIEINDPTFALRRMSRYGLSPGLALNLNTPISKLEPFLRNLRQVLLLCGEAGVAGQGFDDSVLGKIKQLDELRLERNYNFLIGVDGGIHPVTARLCCKAGADDVCCGSWIFNGSQGSAPKAGGTITDRVEQMLDAISC